MKFLITNPTTTSSSHPQPPLREPRSRTQKATLKLLLTLTTLATPLLTHAASYPEIILESNPQAYWRLGDTDGSDFLLDETLNHPLLPQSTAGGELGATGSLDVIGDNDTALNIAFRPNYRASEATPSPALDATGPFSIELWIKTAMFGGTAIANIQPLPSRGFSLGVNDDGIPVFRTGGSSDATGEAWEDTQGGQVSAGRWAHLVCTWDGSFKEIYLNGIRVALQQAQVLPALTSSFTLGGDFNGTLDELAFYRRALPSSEIIRHYEAAGRELEGYMNITSSPTEHSTLITWKGEGWLLETTLDPLGTDSAWEPLPEATSPFSLPIAETFRFFRLVRKPAPPPPAAEEP